MADTRERTLWRTAIIHDGVIPADLVYDCPQYRKELSGFSAPYGTWVAVCGTDLVRTNDGFHILEDNLRVPSGVSYMLANRKASKARLRRIYRQSPRDGSGTLRGGPPGNPERTGPRGARRPGYRAADAGNVQLGLL